jgi:hypothetical protein
VDVVLYNGRRTALVARQALERLPALDIDLVRAPDLALCVPVLAASAQQAAQTNGELRTDRGPRS